VIVLVDLGICNIGSVQLAFQRLGVQVCVGRTPADIKTASAIILPGVGSFGKAMANIAELGLHKPLREHVLVHKRPIVGICLGMQLLAEESEEHGQHSGLGLLPGCIVKLNSDNREVRVPNIGWCDLRLQRESRHIPTTFDGECCYFAHSYHFVSDRPENIVATVDHGALQVAAIVEMDNVFGMQFHPEKSQDVGLDLLKSVISTFDFASV